MDVHDSVAVRGDDRAGHQFQVPRQDHEVDPCRLEHAKPFGGIPGVPQAMGGNALFAGPVKCSGVWTIAQNQYHQGAIRSPDRIQEGNEVRASPGNADSKPERHGART
jgi:hypothetical protein